MWRLVGNSNISALTTGSGSAYSTQIAGHAAGDANFLDLTNFTLNKARLKLIWEF
jgi:hypothetical protein